MEKFETMNRQQIMELCNKHKGLFEHDKAAEGQAREMHPDCMYFGSKAGTHYLECRN